jgi:hypothetical protein
MLGGYELHAMPCRSIIEVSTVAVLLQIEEVPSAGEVCAQSKRLAKRLRNLQPPMAGV